VSAVNQCSLAPVEAAGVINSIIGLNHFLNRAPLEFLWILTA